MRGGRAIRGPGRVDGPLQIRGIDSTLIKLRDGLLVSTECVDGVVRNAVVVRHYGSGDGGYPIGAAWGTRENPSRRVCAVVHYASETVHGGISADDSVAGRRGVIVFVIAACRKSDALDAAGVVAAVVRRRFVGNQVFLIVGEIDFSGQAGGAGVFGHAGAIEIGFNAEGGQKDSCGGSGSVSPGGILPFVLNICGVLENLQGDVAGGIGPVRFRGIDDGLADVVAIGVHRSGPGVNASGAQDIRRALTRVKIEASVVRRITGAGGGLNTTIGLRPGAGNDIRHAERVNSSEPVFVFEARVECPRVVGI